MEIAGEPGGLTLMLGMESEGGHGRSNLLYLTVCVAVFCLIASKRISSARPEQMVALVGGTVIDGNGGPPLKDAVVIIQGKKIIRVGKRGAVKYLQAAKLIDVTRKFVLPGLIDIHVHYRDWMGELFLAHGVTTIKDLGNHIEWISSVSASVEEEKVRGPRIFYVGNGLDAPPPAMETHVGIENPEMAERAVDLLRAKGASAIKVREKITPELLRAITREAHKLGIPVTGHIRYTDAREAALAGIDGLEHASGIPQAIANGPRQVQAGQNEVQTFIADLKSYAAIQLAEERELVKVLVARKVALIPTMANWWRMASERREAFALEDAEYAGIPTLAYVPEDVRKQWASSGFYNLRNADDLAQVRRGYKNLQQLLLDYHSAGGKILAGTDTMFSLPGLSLQREMALLVDAGLTPMKAISVATRENAEFLGKGADLGTITPGKFADLIVVNANPLDDIRNAQRIVLVIKDGHVADTSYHTNYSVPVPKPTRWLERQLRDLGNLRPAGW